MYFHNSVFLYRRVDEARGSVDYAVQGLTPNLRKTVRTPRGQTDRNEKIKNAPRTFLKPIGGHVLSAGHP